jgi:hypothetical protein
MFAPPINYIASVRLVPIFQWEPVEPASGDAPAPTPVVCNSVGSEPQQQPADTSSPEMRLVFKGFGWRPGVEIATFPRPDWMAGIACAAEAEAEDENSSPLESERKARAIEAAKRYAALLAAHIAAASLLDPSIACTPPSESSES